MLELYFVLIIHFIIFEVNKMSTTLSKQFSTFATLARTGEYISSGSTFKWQNTSNASSQNNTYTSLLFTDASNVIQSAPLSISPADQTNYLVCTNLDSDIPSGATIEGIKIYIDRYNSFTGDGTVTLNDDAIYLTKNGTDTVGNNKSTGASWASSDTNTYVTYGGVSDLWGTSWTASEINDNNFGVMISPNISYDSATGENGSDAKIDHVYVEITYTDNTTSRRRAVFVAKNN
jgi:hypothetical protein